MLWIISLQLYSLGDDPNFEFSDEVVIREKAIRVSGKLGGVAGVLHGVIWKNNTNIKMLF